MNKEKNMHSREELEQIIDDIKNTVQLDEDLAQFRSYRMILCYYLWKVQTDQTIRTPEDMETRGYQREGIQFGVMRFSDLLYDFFYDNLDKWEILLSMIGRYTDDELEECLLYTDFYDGEYYEKVPSCISHLVNEILDIQDGEKVLQLNAQTCDYVIDSQRGYSGAEFTAYDEVMLALTKGAIVADIMGYRDITFIDELSEEDRYHKVFANSVMDPTKDIFYHTLNRFISETWKEFPSDVSYAWNTCGWALVSLEESGRAVALMNAGQLTVKQTEEVRRFMCEGGYIEGVIMLPDKMYSDTWVNPFLVILGHDNSYVKFYDARNEYIAGREKGKRINIFSDELVRKIVETYKSGMDVVEVDMDRIRENDYNLSPLRYISVSDTSTKKIVLGDAIREIRRGKSITAAEMDEFISEEPSQKKCIIPASVTGGVISSGLYYHGSIKKPGKNEAGHDDLVISKTGNPFKVALSRDRYVVVGNLYITSIDSSKLNPAYVRCFLNSEQGQRELKKYSVGSTTPVISIENIQKIQIPVFEEEKQKKLNKRCEEIVSELESCYRQIKDDEQELNALFK